METSRLDQILAASEHLFSLQGYHATTMRQIAQAVDLQGGSLYSHIHGKADVLAAIIDRAACQFERAVVPEITDSRPAAARLRAGVQAHLTVLASGGDAATVYLQDWRHLSPERRAAVLAQRDAYEGHWRQLIADGIAEGAFAPVNPRLAAIACLSLCNWTYQWFKPDGPLGIEAIAASYADLLLHGLTEASRPDTEP